MQTTFFIDEWRSPRLGVILKLEANGELSVYGPRGKKFLRPVEIKALADRAETRAERLAAKLRELGIDPEKIDG